MNSWARLYGASATFAQMLLNKGRYGDARILHPITVAQMTRNQIPGVHAEVFNRKHVEAGWGYGANMIEIQRWPWFDGSLVPDGAFTHGGGGGTSFWVDPVRELLGVYFSFCNIRDPVTDEYMWDFDLFQNMATAAVA
jgi:CubicO group peptidase (beta-lactamase class C family)